MKYENRNTYRILYKPDHPSSGEKGLILEHRLVMEEKLGRPLTSDEHVHHINGDRANNDPDNLKVMSNSAHIRMHLSMRGCNMFKQEKVSKKEYQHRRDTMNPQDRSEFLDEFGPDVETLQKEAQELGVDVDIYNFLGLTKGGDTADMT